MPTDPPTVTLFLYQVLEDRTVRNRPRTSRIVNGNVVTTRPPLGLALHYMVSAWGGDRHTEQRVWAAATDERKHEERRKDHDQRDPRRLRHHDRLELPAIVRGDRRRFHHAARDGGKERGHAVDAGEPHVDQSADGADDGGEKRGADDQRQKRNKLGDHGSGELQAGRGAGHHRSRRPSPRDEPHRRAGERQRHGGKQRSEQPRQRQMHEAREKTPGNAAGER